MKRIILLMILCCCLCSCKKTVQPLSQDGFGYDIDSCFGKTDNDISESLAKDGIELDVDEQYTEGSIKTLYFIENVEGIEFTTSLVFYQRDGKFTLNEYYKTADFAEYPSNETLEKVKAIFQNIALKYGEASMRDNGLYTTSDIPNLTQNDLFSGDLVLLQWFQDNGGFCSASLMGTENFNLRISVFSCYE